VKSVEDEADLISTKPTRPGAAGPRHFLEASVSLLRFARDIHFMGCRARRGTEALASIARTGSQPNCGPIIILSVLK